MKINTRKLTIIITSFYSHLPEHWLFKAWLWSMIIFLVAFPLEISGVTTGSFEAFLGLGLIILCVVGIALFCFWLLKMLIGLIFSNRTLALKELIKTGVIIVVFFVLLIPIIIVVPTKTKHLISEKIATSSSNEAMSKGYIFKDKYPEKSVYMQDFTIKDDVRRFRAYIFDDNLNLVSTGNNSELRIDNGSETSFKFYGNNVYMSQLLNNIKDGVRYNEETINYKNTNFEKSVRVIYETTSNKQVLHYLFQFGGLDYLITTEWNLDSDYRSLADKLIATLSPSTMTREYANQLFKVDSSATPEPSPSLPHVALCFVDKNGKFDIFFTECQQMFNQDKESFRRRAIEICKDGRSPAMTFQQATNEQKEEMCTKFFSGDAPPIAIESKQ